MNYLLSNFFQLNFYFCFVLTSNNGDGFRRLLCPPALQLKEPHLLFVLTLHLLIVFDEIFILNGLIPKMIVK